MRSEDELREFLLRLKADGIETIGVTFYGLQDLHDRWSGRKGDFGYAMQIARLAGECGLKRNESIILSRKSAPEIPALVEMLDRLPGERDRYVFPWDYRGCAKTIESERVMASDVESLPEEIRQCITKIGHKGYRSEAEWIARIEAGDIPHKGRRFYILTVWEDNVEWLEREDCGSILRKLREDDERLHQAIPSLATLARLYGQNAGRRVYSLRDLEWKWMDRYLKAHPEIDPTGRMNDLSNVVMWH